MTQNQNPDSSASLPTNEAAPTAEHETAGSSESQPDTPRPRLAVSSRRSRLTVPPIPSAEAISAVESSPPPAMESSVAAANSAEPASPVETEPEQIPAARQEPVPATPVKPTPPDSENQAATPLPRIKHRKSALPPSAQKVMAEQEEEKQDIRNRKKKRRTETTPPSTLANVLTALVGWIFLAGALAAATLPLWQPWPGIDNLQQPIRITILAGILGIGIFMLIQRTFSRIIATVLILAPGLLLAAVLWLDYQPQTTPVWILNMPTTDYLADGGWLIASTMMMLAALILNLPYSPLRLTGALMLAGGAAVAPWLDEASLGLPGAMPLPSGFDTALIESWKPIERGPNQAVWARTDSRNDLFRIQYYPKTTDKNNFDDFRSMLEAKWAAENLGAVSNIPLLDRPHHNRYLRFGSNGRVLDAIAVFSEENDGFFLISFEVDNYSARNLMISDLFRQIQ